ncbi:MAG: hypothetical protein KUL82_02995 [Bdellovibrio sp.]|nr:hypothetical protein [Bdellovibrio sp.]
MEPIKLKTWILWALVLFGLGLLTDYYFLHLLFHEKQNALNGAKIVSAESSQNSSNPALSDESFLGAPESSESSPEDSNKDNFLSALQNCAPEIAAQTVGTPEGLVEYLQKSVGVKKEDVSLENYHLTLPNGSLRRIHVIVADNTNSSSKKELRFFKLDAEGYPERLPLKGNETLLSLLALGTVTKHEARSQFLLKDDSSLALEMHDQKVFELQYNNHGKVLSCRFKDCLCQ